MGILMVFIYIYNYIYMYMFVGYLWEPLVIIAIAMVQGCPIHKGSWMVWLSHVSIKSLEALPGKRSHSAEPRVEVTEVTDLLMTSF